MMRSNFHICIIGNMLGKNAGYITTQGQILAEKLAPEGYRVTCVSKRINRVVRLGEIIMVLLMKNKLIDLVVLEVYSGLYFYLAEIVSALCSLVRLPLILVLHGGNLPSFAETHPTRVRRVFNQAAAIVSPSDYLARAFVQAGFEITVIPNIVEFDHDLYRERTRAEPRLLWMRSFHPNYNPEMGVRVLAKVRAKFPDAKLTMAGKDKGLEPAVKDLALKMNVHEDIRFPGFLDQAAKAKEFSEADIFINTNRIDNMPVSVVEACSFGLPVVATSVGGIPDLLTDRSEGILVEDGNVEEMVEAVEELLSDPELAGKISRNGRRLAEKSIWTAVRPMWEQLFEKVLVKDTHAVQASTASLYTRE